MKACTRSSAVQDNISKFQFIQLIRMERQGSRMM